MCEPRVSPDCRGRLRDVRELLNEERRLLRLKSRRTPPGLPRFCGEDEDSWVPEVGDVVLRRLFVSFLLIAWPFSPPFSASSEAMPVAGGVAGCDVRGPPPGVGGSMGDCFCGDSVGAGMSVPSVRE